MPGTTPPALLCATLGFRKQLGAHRASPKGQLAFFVQKMRSLLFALPDPEVERAVGPASFFCPYLNPFPTGAFPSAKIDASAWFPERRWFSYPEVEVNPSCLGNLDFAASFFGGRLGLLAALACHSRSQPCSLFVLLWLWFRFLLWNGRA